MGTRVGWLEGLKVGATVGETEVIKIEDTLVFTLGVFLEKMRLFPRIVVIVTFKPAGTFIEPILKLVNTM